MESSQLKYARKRVHITRAFMYAVYALALFLFLVITMSSGSYSWSAAGEYSGVANGGRTMKLFTSNITYNADNNTSTCGTYKCNENIETGYLFNIMLTNLMVLLFATAAFAGAAIYHGVMGYSTPMPEVPDAAKVSALERKIQHFDVYSFSVFAICFSVYATSLCVLITMGSASMVFKDFVIVFMFYMVMIVIQAREADFLNSTLDKLFSDDDSPLRKEQAVFAHEAWMHRIMRVVAPPLIAALLITAYSLDFKNVYGDSTINILFAVFITAIAAVLVFSFAQFFLILSNGKGGNLSPSRDAMGMGLVWLFNTLCVVLIMVNAQYNSQIVYNGYKFTNM